MHDFITYQPVKTKRPYHAFSLRPLFSGILFIFLSLNLFGQENQPFDEISVQFSVPRLGNTDIPVLIREEEAWISVKEVFDFLKIKCAYSRSLDSLQGYFIEPDSKFLIESDHKRIIYNENLYDLSSSDLIHSETGIYLQSTHFNSIFGLDLQFSFRNLLITLKTDLDLPVFREMRQEQYRKNLSLLKGEKKPDSTIQRSFSWLNMGMADWSVTSTRGTEGDAYLKANLLVGATIAGGEATANMSFYNDRPFDAGKQFYRWRYVNNDLEIFKQISLGHLISPTVSTILSPINGIQVTNTPTTYRKSFGTYRYTGNTEPAYVVELYVNNILVDYVKSDASGFFAFDIPVVYGNSSIVLRFFSPWGEEYSKQENITIPFNFLPSRKLEYTLAAGLTQDKLHSRFSTLGISYGLNNRITIGAGAEYFSSAMEGKPFPILKTSIRLFDGIILDGEYAMGVRSKAGLHYRLPSNWQLDLGYIKYTPGQTAIRFNYLEERKASLTIPLKGKRFKVISRLSYNQFILSKFQYSSAEVLISAGTGKISSNFRTYAQFSGSTDPSFFSNLSLSFHLPKGIRFTPQVQYQYDQHQLGILKAEIEKRITSKGYFNFSFEHNRYLLNNVFTAGFRYDFSFARSFFSVSRNNISTLTTQSASGSFIFDRKAKYFKAQKQSSVGRGSILITPFLDLNGNGSREKAEPVVDGLQLRVSGGRIERRKDSSLLVSGLEAYSSYLIELDKESFDNISWRIKNTVLKITAEPNRLKIVEVPVSVVGEATGMVFLKTGEHHKGLARIKINFYDGNHKFVAHTISESDGYFSYLGLPPGNYQAQVDTSSLKLFHIDFFPAPLSFTIYQNEEGTIADGLNFILIKEL